MMTNKVKLERLDRLLSRLGYGSRRDVEFWIKLGLITVDGVAAKQSKQKVYPDDVLLEEKPLDHPYGLTVIYHKPLGLVCSRKEDGGFIYEDFPERWLGRKPIFSSVGRLDKDTSGLLILTDNGVFNHDLTSPKHGVSKTYQVELARDLSGHEADKLASGTLMLEADDRPCLPAELAVFEPRRVQIVLHEGRYHQVRRMFAALGNHVETLSRSHIGVFSLDDSGLAAGEWKDVPAEELWQQVRGA